MFERLMNLDVELRCLATKAYVAKQELTSELFYPTSDDEEDEEELTAEETVVEQVSQENCEEKGEGESSSEGEEYYPSALKSFMKSLKGTAVAVESDKKDSDSGE